MGKDQLRGFLAFSACQAEAHYPHEDRGRIYRHGLQAFAVPRLLEQWRVEHRIDDYDFQFSSDFFLTYYNRYVHKYLAYFFIAVNLIIGIMNGILYLFIG